MDTGLGAKAYAIIEQGKIGMILSSRPTDRRQLIEEAAGITKYKARRRAAELKLEAAQQNLTRIDDIVFEVEKQRGSLKRQAAKARRYMRLRDEMRRWEKVLFARRYRTLGEMIESARARLADAREQQATRRGAAGGSGERARPRCASSWRRPNRPRRGVARSGARPRARDQSAPAADCARYAAGRDAADARRASSRSSATTLEARREPERLALDERRRAALEAEAARDEAAAVAADAAAEHARAQHAIEGAEQDVERARAEVYAVVNTVTALTAALDAAAAQRERAAEMLADSKSRPPISRTEHERAIARAHAAANALTRLRTRRSTPPKSRARRASRSWRARAPSTNGAPATCARASTSSPSLSARLRSLEELDAHRAGFSDAARMVLVQANGRVGQMGAARRHHRGAAALRARRRSVPGRSAAARARPPARPRRCGPGARARARRRPVRLRRRGCRGDRAASSADASAGMAAGCRARCRPGR